MDKHIIAQNREPNLVLLLGSFCPPEGQVYEREGLDQKAALRELDQQTSVLKFNLIHTFFFSIDDANILDGVIKYSLELLDLRLHLQRDIIVIIYSCA